MTTTNNNTAAVHDHAAVLGFAKATNAPRDFVREVEHALRTALQAVSATIGNAIVGPAFDAGATAARTSTPAQRRQTATRYKSLYPYHA